jgi:hypothetical protein
MDIVKNKTLSCIFFDKEDKCVDVKNQRTTSYLMLNESKDIMENLEGQVFFKGTPCNPDSFYYKVPPCSGPYPNFEIDIYSDKTDENRNKILVTKIKTDLNGNFKTLLAPGNYVIYTKAGKFSSDIKTYEFVIEENKNAKLDIFVDTGVR